MILILIYANTAVEPKEPLPPEVNWLTGQKLMAFLPEMAPDYVRSYWNPSGSGEFSLQRKGWGRRCAAEDGPDPGRVDGAESVYGE